LYTRLTNVHRIDGEPNSKDDPVNKLVKILDDLDISFAPQYVGNTLEIYSTKDHMTEVLVNWCDKNIKVFKKF